MYTRTPPWDIGRPQPAFLELARAGHLRGRVLDAGCGTGEHALLAASLGLEAWGIDTSPTAIGAATAKARERGLEVHFLIHDALELATLGEGFDTALDSGLFHVFDDTDRRRYVESLAGVVRAGGTGYVLCFSDQQPGFYGPRRISTGELRASFADGWEVASIRATTMALADERGSAAALLGAFTRT